MDVTLVLTHRCNLACTYCYAGDHHGAEMDDATMDGALDLLYAENETSAQLSFFGGEPFLAFGAMKRAVAGARTRAAGRELTLQCTTNGAALSEEHVRFIVETGMRVTVSIDGVEEAHDQSRRRAGGQSSHAAVTRGLRMLVAAGARPEAMMVVTPGTARWVSESVTWLWNFGVERVRANLSLRDNWDGDREALHGELVAVGRELLSRRLDLRRQLLHGSTADVPVVEFEPFAARGGSCGPSRRQIVVGTSGNLYPCAPLVGEDRDDGPEAALRVGHLKDGAPADCEDSCSSGGACACAAYLETGDPTSGGENGLWYARVCREIGDSVIASLASSTFKPLSLTVASLPAPPRRKRRGVLVGALLGMSSLALAGGAQLVPLRLSRDAPSIPPLPPPTPPPVVHKIAGEIKANPPPPPGGLSPPPSPPKKR